MKKSEMRKLPRSRAEALAAGADRYYTRKPCKHGHDSPRYTANGTCVQCSTERATRWQKRNRARFNEYRAQWRAKNREKLREYQKNWREARKS